MFCHSRHVLLPLLDHPDLFPHSDVFDGDSPIDQEHPEFGPVRELGPFLDAATEPTDATVRLEIGMNRIEEHLAADVVSREIAGVEKRKIMKNYVIFGISFSTLNFRFSSRHLKTVERATVEN